MLKIWAGIVGLAIMALPAVGNTGELACLPGVSSHIYAKREFRISRDQAIRLHAYLERHSNEIGLSYSSVEGTDPATALRPARESMTSILQSKSVSTVIEISTSSHSKFVRIHIENTCFVPLEDWRPYWTRFNSMLTSLGYGSSR